MNFSARVNIPICSRKPYDNGVYDEGTWKYLLEKLRFPEPRPRLLWNRIRVIIHC